MKTRNTNNTTTQKKDDTDMTELTITLSDDALATIAEQVAALLGTEDAVEAAPKAAAKGKAKPAATKAKAKAKVEEPEDDEEEEDEKESDVDPEARKAELAKMRITTLRKMALELGFDDEEVKDADKDTLADAIAEAEAEEEGDDDESDESDEDEDEADEEEEDEEDDSDEYTEEDYKAMSLADLKGVAKEAGWTVAELKGLKKADIIEALLDASEEEDEEEDEDDEAEGEWYTEEELGDMSLAELKAICKDNDIKIPRGAKADALVDLIVEAGEEEDDEE